jgi:hypothetical protein
MKVALWSAILSRLQSTHSLFAKRQLFSQAQFSHFPAAAARCMRLDPVKGQGLRKILHVPVFVPAILKSNTPQR